MEDNVKKQIDKILLITSEKVSLIVTNLMALLVILVDDRRKRQIQYPSSNYSLFLSAN